MKIQLRSLIALMMSCSFAGVIAQNVMENAPAADVTPVSSEVFQRDWAQIDKRPLPKWFNEAKFGIFVVWGPYSIPAYSPVGPNGYAEWYYNRLKNGDKALTGFHKRLYGDASMVDMIDQLTGEMFDAEQWCDLFERSGAKYVVTTANYHDGFAMYPTKYAVTEGSDRWNSTVAGPMRDVIGELNIAGERHNLKMGIYFSLYEWYHPLWLSDKERFVTEHFHPKLKEVVERYKPWSIFFDGDWGQSGEKWRANELAKWLYNESAVKDKVVVNDRWGSSRGINGDVFESEYGYGKWTSPEHPWQEDRGIGQSYGYNRQESAEDYNSTAELLEQLSLVTAGGGNFLLCVGPTADGRIPVIMQQRLLEIGDWLKINGEAIYGAKANPFWPRTFDWGTITQKENKLYLHIFNPDDREITIDGIEAQIEAACVIDKRGEKQPLKFRNKRGELSFTIPTDVALGTTINIVELTTQGEITCDKRAHTTRNGELELTCRAFKYTNPKITPQYGGFRDRMKLIGWSDRNDSATVEIVIDKGGEYELEVAYVEPGKWAGCEVEFEINGQKLHHKTTRSVENDEYIYVPRKLGKVKFDKGGAYTIEIRAKEGGKWSNFGLQSLKLVKN